MAEFLAQYPLLSDFIAWISQFVAAAVGSGIYMWFNPTYKAGFNKKTFADTFFAIVVGWAAGQWAVEEYPHLKPWALLMLQAGIAAITVEAVTMFFTEFRFIAFTAVGALWNKFLSLIPNLDDIRNWFPKKEK